MATTILRFTHHKTLLKPPLMVKPQNPLFLATKHKSNQCRGLHDDDDHHHHHRGLHTSLTQQFLISLVINFF